jgi:hypothetical protein
VAWIARRDAKDKQTSTGSWVQQEDFIVKILLVEEAVNPLAIGREAREGGNKLHPN